MRTTLKIIPVWLLLSLPQSTWAAEIFTFEGTIVEIQNDIYGYAANAGFQVGDTVTYTYLVDFDLPGLITNSDGSQYAPANNATNTYYYADYLYGSGLNTPFATSGEHNFARDFLLDDGRIFGGVFGEHRVSVEGFGQVFSEWTVGQVAQGFDIWDIDTSDNHIFDGYVRSTLTLTSRHTQGAAVAASNSTQVPLSSTVLLVLFIGLLALPSCRQRFITH